MGFRFPAIQERHHQSLFTLFQASLLQIMGDASKSKPQIQNPLTTGPLSLPIPLSPIKNEKYKNANSAMLIHHEIEGDSDDEKVKNLVKSILEKNGALLKSQVHDIFRFQASQGILLLRIIYTFCSLLATEIQVMIDNVPAVTLESVITTLSFEIRDDIVAPQPNLEIPLGRFKKATLNHFKVHDQVKKSEMMGIWEKECEGKPSASVYSKIMNEVATTKSSGIWKLKWIGD